MNRYFHSLDPYQVLQSLPLGCGNVAADTSGLSAHICLWITRLCLVHVIIITCHKTSYSSLGEGRGRGKELPVTVVRCYRGCPQLPLKKAETVSFADCDYCLVPMSTIESLAYRDVTITDLCLITGMLKKSCTQAGEATARTQGNHLYPVTTVLT